MDRAAKIAFLRGLDVLSVPSPYAEPKGLYLLEAMANGLPWVQPRHGAYPEWIAATNGGLLVEPGSAAALAAGLRTLVDDPELRQRLGRQGREAALTRFDHNAAADDMLAVYEGVLAGRRAAAAVQPVQPADDRMALHA